MDDQNQTDNQVELFDGHELAMTARQILDRIKRTKDPLTILQLSEALLNVWSSYQTALNVLTDLNSLPDSATDNNDEDHWEFEN